MIPNRTILIGDVLEKIREIPGESIDVTVTSPPYFALRDYGIEGQWGLEGDFREFLKKLDTLMAELKRVTKKTGTVWVNLGDSYAGGTAHSDWSGTDEKFDKRCKNNKWSGPLKNDLQAKSRYGIPERFYINCIDNGWIARNHIPWIKPNAMPSSVRDRFSNKWESIFFFSKSQKYYFNLNAVREKPLTEQKPLKKSRLATINQPLFDYLDRVYDDKETKDSLQDKDTNTARLHRNRDGNPNKQDTTLGADGKPKATYAGFNERWKYRGRPNEPKGYTSIHERMAYKRKVEGVDHDAALNHPAGKNPGDIFIIPSKPFVEAHFATFPLELPLKILKAAGPNQVCSNCGDPRMPILEPSEAYKKYLGKGWHDHSADLEQGMQQTGEKHSVAADYRIVDWTKCDCDEAFVAGTVLDPFFGAGTTAEAAEKLGLNWVGIEINPKYVSEIITKRLDKFKNERLSEF